MSRFLSEVRAKLFEAKFILEQNPTHEGCQEAIDKIRAALDLCALADRLIEALVPKAQDHLLVDTLSNSLAKPALVTEFDSEPPTEIKDKP
jgi:hypothetical protein